MFIVDIIDPCHNPPVTVTPIQDATFIIGQPAIEVVVPAFIDTTTYCGSFTYSEINPDSSFINFDLPNMKYTVFTTNWDKYGSYSITVSGVLYTGFQVDNTFNLNVGGSCLLAILTAPVIEDYTYYIGDAQLKIDIPDFQSDYSSAACGEF